MAEILPFLFGTASDKRGVLAYRQDTDRLTRGVRQAAFDTGARPERRASASPPRPAIDTLPREVPMKPAGRPESQADG
jgi:hypothetical protein